MSKQIEAMKLALDWANKLAKEAGEAGNAYLVAGLVKIIVPLRQAIADAEQPAQQEPDLDELTIAYMSGVYEGKKRKPWVGLTDEERQEIWKGCDPTHAGYVTALVEAKLKEKNTKGGAA